jgi:hypothetical protein
MGAGREDLFEEPGVTPEDDGIEEGLSVMHAHNTSAVQAVESSRIVIVPLYAIAHSRDNEMVDLCFGDALMLVNVEQGE